MTIRIVLVDDHKDYRQSLYGVLAREPGLEIVGEAEDGLAAVDRVSELAPDVVIMDIAMPNVNGIEATRRIASRFPQVRVVGLTMHSDKRLMAQMCEAGALCCVLKDRAFEELAGAIRRVAGG